MPVLDNQRHEIFAQEIFKGASGRDAYIRAGYKAGNMNAVDASASALLRNPKVDARVNELKSLVAEKAVIDRQWVIARLIENVDRAMQAVAVKDAEGSPTGEYRYEGSVANKALELLGKEIGMFIERRENTNRTYVIGAQALTDDEWEAKYCLAAPAGTPASTH